MVEELVGIVFGWWNWVLNQLGWSGELGWFKILVLVLAFFGAMFILRRLFGGAQGGGSTVVCPPSERQGGLPTRFYVGSEKLGDFSVPKEVYDFKVPTPTPDLSNLRKPLKVDMELARKMFVPNMGEKSGEPQQKEDAGLTAQCGEPQSLSPLPVVAHHSLHSPTGGFKPDWNLARKLFIPRFRGRNDSSNEQVGASEDPQENC